MSESIIINGKVITIRNAPYAVRNANFILLSGYILHTLDLSNINRKSDITVAPEHKNEILGQVQQAEGSLFQGIHAIADIVSAADSGLLEDSTLEDVGQLLRMVTSLLEKIQTTRSQLTHVFNQGEDSI